jgi:dimethylhistidine N-methyltransferase
VPIDISKEHLLDNAESFANDFPDLRVAAVCADFTKRVDLADVVPREDRVGFFPGSTIGNFTPDAARLFLREIAATLGPGGMLIVGVDLVKDPRILEAAYDDDQGVTALFNLNLLRRINRELGADFDLGSFRHRAFFNAEKARIEMHLESQKDQTVSVANTRFDFAEGETIHTENSYKYTVESFQDLAGEAGFAGVKVWVDPDQLFSVHGLRVE